MVLGYTVKLYQEKFWNSDVYKISDFPDCALSILLFMETSVCMQEFSKQTKRDIPCLALASVAQWVRHYPANWKVIGLIPGQGTCLGFRFSPWLGLVQEAIDWCFSPTLLFLSLSPSLPLSLKSVGMSSGEDERERHTERDRERKTERPPVLKFFGQIYYFGQLNKKRFWWKKIGG